MSEQGEDIEGKEQKDHDDIRRIVKECKREVALCYMHVSDPHTLTHDKRRVSETVQSCHIAFEVH
jgi:hypothetical protein